MSTPNKGAIRAAKDEARARVEATTPGVWEHVIDQNRSREHSVWAGGRDGTYVAEWIGNEADAEFIVHARDDLLAALEREAALAEAVRDLHIAASLAVQDLARAKRATSAAVPLIDRAERSVPWVFPWHTDDGTVGPRLRCFCGGEHLTGSCLGGRR